MGVVTGRSITDPQLAGTSVVTYTAVSIGADDAVSPTSADLRYIDRLDGTCVAVALNDGTTAITWQGAPDGHVTLLDPVVGRYQPLEWLPRHDNGTAYYVDSITDQAGQPSPDYRVMVAHPDGILSGQACDGRSFSTSEFTRLETMDFPVTQDGHIGRTAPTATPTPVNLFATEDAPAAPATGEAPAVSLCSTGSIGYSAADGSEGTSVVEFQVPAGVEVRGDLSKFGDEIRSYGATHGSFAVTRKVGDSWVSVPAFLNSAHVGPGQTYTQDVRVFAAPAAGTYRVTAGPTWWWYMNSANWSLLNIRFTNGDGDFIADPCSGLEQITHCMAVGGGMYVAPGATTQRDGQIFGPGCYAVETCATTSYAAVIDQVARWACRNEAFLDVAQDAATAVAIVSGVIIVAPVSAGVALAGAGAGLVLAPWTCDQSDNGWYVPATSFSDVSSSCVATEVSLGAIFAPLAGAGPTATAGRAIAVGCVEGGTSTAVYSYQHPDTTIDPNNIAIGTALGCATGGIIHSGVQRVRGVRPDGLNLPGTVVGGTHPLRAINPTRDLEYNCGYCAIALDSTLGGNPAVAESAGTLLNAKEVAELLGLVVDDWGPIRYSTDSIVAEIQAAGPGARGVIYGGVGDVMNPGLGHFWNVINQAGEVKFLDGQIGEVVTDFSRFNFFGLLRTN